MDKPGVAEDRHRDEEPRKAHHHVCPLDSHQPKNGHRHLLGSPALLHEFPHDAAEADDDTDMSQGSPEAPRYGFQSLLNGKFRKKTHDHRGDDKGGEGMNLGPDNEEEKKNNTYSQSYA